MNRRKFLKRVLSGVLGITGFMLIEGCMAPLVSPKIFDERNGSPWRCGYCGHLTRSTADLTGTRCPRCGRKQLGRISESELQQYLKEGA